MALRMAAAVMLVLAIGFRALAQLRILSRLWDKATSGVPPFDSAAGPIRSGASPSSEESDRYRASALPTRPATINTNSAMSNGFARWV